MIYIYLMISLYFIVYHIATTVVEQESCSSSGVLCDIWRYIIIIIDDNNWLIMKNVI